MSGVAQSLNGAAAGFLAAVLLCVSSLAGAHVTIQVTGTEKTPLCPAGTVPTQYKFSGSGRTYYGATASEACQTAGTGFVPNTAPVNDHGNAVLGYRSLAQQTMANLGSCTIYWASGGHGGNPNATGTMSISACTTPPPASCSIPAGTEYGSYTNPVDPNNSASVSGCYQNCSHTGYLITVDGVGVLRRWVSTGQSCNSAPAIPPDVTPQQVATTDPPSTQNAVCVAGTSNCLPVSNKNCGLVNGEYRCLGTDVSEANPCVTTASGAMFCIGSAPNSPDAGVPGTVAPPDTSFQGVRESGTSTNPGTINYYNSTTVSNSTNYGNGDGNSDGEGSCGGYGQPDCRVRINETGTPSTYSPPEQDTDAVERFNFVKGAAEGSPTGEVQTDGFLDLLPEASEQCQTITVNFFGGRTKTFPGPLMCDALDKIRAVLAWILGLLTTFVCLRDTIRSM